MPLNSVEIIVVRSKVMTVKEVVDSRVRSGRALVVGDFDRRDCPYSLTNEQLSMLYDAF